MNLGQTMLAIGALILMSIMALSYYFHMGMSGLAVTDTKSGIMTTTIAISCLEQVQNMAFDDPQNGIRTIPDLLGRDADEDSISNFDDIDDFRGWIDTVTIQTDSVQREDDHRYQVVYDVYYVNPNGDLEVKAGNITRLKRVDVTVQRIYPMIDTNASVIGPMKMSTILARFQ